MIFFGIFGYDDEGVIDKKQFSYLKIGTLLVGGRGYNLFYYMLETPFPILTKV